MISYPQLVPILLRKKLSEDPRGLGEFEKRQSNISFELSLLELASGSKANWGLSFRTQELASVAQLNSSLSRPTLRTTTGRQPAFPPVTGRSCRAGSASPEVAVA
jgi:hypothetical protein